MIVAIRQLTYQNGIAFVQTDPRLPDNPIVDCNSSFLKLTGYEREEVIGHNCRFLGGSGTDPAQKKILRKAIDEERSIVVELLNYKKDGTPFVNAIMVAPIYEGSSKLIGFLGSQVDTSHFSLGKRRRESIERVACLTSRQKQVLNKLVAGSPISQIAGDLRLSERTVRMHRNELVKSLKVATTNEAIRVAVEAGL